LGYPYFCKILDQFRPGATISLEDYVMGCHNLGFADMCRDKWNFTDEELKEEYLGWKDYIRTHIPDPYDGIREILHRQKAEGGMICVVSHSAFENITRDYETHFGITPDAIYGWDLTEHQRKPNPYPLLDIMTRYDLKPEDILVVDDMKLACQMAEPLGIKVAYAGWNGLSIPEIDAEMKALCEFSFDSTEKLYNFLFD
jgi:phosphoglycolate phosphatase/pyrophosphatase PpaX